MSASELSLRRSSYIFCLALGKISSKSYFLTKENIGLQINSLRSCHLYVTSLLLWSSISFTSQLTYLLFVVTRFSSTVESVKSFFALKLLAESDFGATHRHSVSDKEGIKLRFLVSPQTNFIVYDVGARTENRSIDKDAVVHVVVVRKRLTEF